VALDGCLVVIVQFEPPDGPRPFGYVIDGPLPGDLPCRVQLLNTCIVEFPRTAGTCDYTLRTVDAAGRRGPPSASFCIERIGVG
jgi:hypothetical protein